MSKTFIEILEELEKTTGTNDKIDILQKNKDVDFLKQYLDYATNPKITFGIAEIDETVTDEVAPDVDTIKNMFVDMADKLKNRELTGGNARTNIAMLLNACNDLEKKWYKKCFMKDLASIGLGLRLLEKAFGEVKKFKLMLAEPFEEMEKVDDEKGYLDKKANGVRTIIIVEDGKVVAIYGGRNGLIAENFYFIVEEIETLAALLPNDQNSFVLDGEMHVKDCLEDTMSLYGFKFRDQSEFIGKNGKLKEKAWLSYKEDEDRILKFKADAKFVAFDVLKIDDWNNQTCSRQLHERKKDLEALDFWIKGNGIRRLEIIETEYVENQAEAIKAAQRWIDNGFEGGIYKRWSGLYEWKRSRNSIKIKEEIDLDVQIVGFEISKTKFNPDGSPKPEMLGKFLVVDANGSQFGVGTGHYLSEAKRIEIWNDQATYLGKILKLTAQRGSKNSYACPRVESLDWEADCLRIDKSEI